MPTLTALPQAFLRTATGRLDFSVPSLWSAASGLPGGKAVFTRAVCFKAPYFGSIHPYIEELRSGHCEVRIKDRRGVRNHLGSVHAIAMCNMAELAGGMATEATVPPGARWIPKSMTVEYLRKARGPLRAIADVDPILDHDDGTDVIATVNIIDGSEQTVMHAEITMRVSPAKSRSATR